MGVKTGQSYVIGIDIGNGSVGWSVLNQHNRLMRVRGRDLIGARIFEPAETAEDRRMHRTTRRRLARRRWRIRLLNNLFDSEISKIDPAFFARLKYTWVHSKDTYNTQHYYGGYLFSGSDDKCNLDADFYDTYPTIYHLRRALTQDTNQHDIREVYLAIHHIVKYRGHFLTEGDINAKSVFAVSQFLDTINHIFEILDLQDCVLIGDEYDSTWHKALYEALLDTRGSKSMRVDAVMDLLKIEDAKAKKAAKELARACLGVTANLALVMRPKDLGADDKKKLKINFSSGDFEENINAVIESGLTDDEESALCLEIQDLVSAVKLGQLLGDSVSISEVMCKLYDKHHRNWSIIRGLANNVSDIHERAALRAQMDKYYGKVLGWEIKNGKKITVKTDIAAQKNFIEIIENNSTYLDEETKQSLLQDIENNELFPVQRSSNNGVIPHQLHLNELRQIIQHQAPYYPWLAQTVDIDGQQVNMIEALMTFRVPYFVGPLVAPEDMLQEHNKANHWMKRKAPGVITPWNFGQLVDKDESGRRFIQRLVGTDTYLLGEETLPKNSLLYQNFMVHNELNNIRISGTHAIEDRPRRLFAEEKQWLIEECFKKRQTVTRRQAEEVLKAHEPQGFSITITGLSDDSKFASTMSSYRLLCRVFGQQFVEDPSNNDLLEQILLLQTIFEDKKTLTHQLELLQVLDAKQIQQLSNKHMTGWGNLSRKLLTSRIASCILSEDVVPRKHSIIEILQDTSRNLMEILTDSKYGVQQWIDEQNNLWLNSQESSAASSRQNVVDQLRVSGKVKRGIIQTMAVIDDIQKAIGYPPTRVFVELADDVQPSVRSTPRSAWLSNTYAEAMKNNSSLKSELQAIEQSLRLHRDELSDDRLFLYYVQQGKDMYTGKEINLDRLSSDYDIDHIVPRAVTVDNSIDNRVLVARGANARKSDKGAETQDFPQEAKALWEKLLKCGLISENKYQRLIRGSEYWSKNKDRFVARSLVETRQIMKNVITILRGEYGNNVEDDIVIGLPSELTKDMRRYLGFEHKNRDINDLHHAQDALCIAATGQFAYRCKWLLHGAMTEDAKYSFQNYFEYAEQQHRAKLTGVQSAGKDVAGARAFGFVVGSMRSTKEELRQDPDTGTIVWNESDAEYLRKVMNYKTMLITYKAGDVSSALYKESRLAADPKAKLIPYDSQRANTALYGGFKEPKTACMVLVEDKKTHLININMSDYSRYQQVVAHNGQLTDWLRTYKGLSKQGRVLIAHVPVGQLICWHKAHNRRAHQMTVKSAAEFNNAQQLWLPQQDYNFVDYALGDVDEAHVQHWLDQHDKRTISTDERLIEIYTQLLGIAVALYPAYNTDEQKISTSLSSFIELDFAEKKKILQGLISAMHVGAGRSDLKRVGLASAWGRVSAGSSQFGFSDSDVFVFQSPSGIFSEKISIAELKKKADSKESARL